MTSFQLPLQKLSNRHYMVMCLLACGQFTQIEVAQRVGFTKEYIWQLQQSPLFKSELDRMRDNLLRRIEARAIDRLVGEAEASVDKLIEIRDDPNASKMMQTRAAVEILDRNPATAKWHKGAQLQASEPALSDDQIALLTSTFAMDTTAQIALAQARAVIEQAAADLDEREAREALARESAGSSADANADANAPPDDELHLLDLPDDLGV